VLPGTQIGFPTSLCVWVSKRAYWRSAVNTIRDSAQPKL
jgi:hypothetical protein